MPHEPGEQPWQVSFAHRADKDMDRLDPPVRKRVAEGIERLAAGDRTADVRKLKASDEHRLRVGELRVRFRREPAGRQIVVLRVLPRGRAYQG
jgi:mRNA-degrading endonuclease RelE of RelBE toxin-antitoxin system